MVTIGVDTHKATLAASAIDEAGRERGAETFPNDGKGHAELLHWARMHGPRGTRSAGTTLTRWQHRVGREDGIDPRTARASMAAAGRRLIPAGSP